MSGSRMGQFHELACGRGTISAAALQFVYSTTNMWFADPQTTCTIRVSLLQILCWHRVESEGPSHPWAWFAEGQEGAGLVLGTSQ